MANTKEVRKQIASIKSTQKITSAMEMVAASKMRKTQDAMLVGQLTSQKIKEVISHVATSNSEYSHPFFEERKQRKFALLLLALIKVYVAASILIYLKALLQKQLNLIKMK